MAGFDVVVREDGKLDFRLDADGQLAFTESPVPELLLAIKIPLGKYRGDPEAGSDVPNLITGTPPADREAALVDAATAAIRRIEDTGLVRLESVEYESKDGRDALVINTSDLGRLRVPL